MTSQKNITINPFNLQEINQYEFDTKKNIDEKLLISNESFKMWSKFKLDERIKQLKLFRNELSNRKKQIASLMTEEMGKPIKQSVGEVDRCLRIIDYSFENASKFLQDEVVDFSNGKAHITYCPQGVILGIQPWNFPLYQVIRFMIPNLIAGNTVLLKHANNVWGTALEIEQIFESSNICDGIFQVLKAKEDDLDQLYSSKFVRGVTFTGSDKVGRIIGKKAGENLKKTVLELGGNDAYIVLKDCDLDLAVQKCVEGRVVNNGETCISAKRFLVEAEIYDEFKNKFVESMRSLNVGDPKNEDTNIGPLSRQDILEKLETQVNKSIEKGAKCLTGGERLNMEGLFYAPTVLESIKPGMPAYDEELFGPVASLIRVDNLEDAIQISNNSKYGLGGGIFGADKDELVDISKNYLDTGMVNVNGYGSADANIPFGGVKDSGYGREFNHHGFREFVNIKSIMVHN